MNSYNYKPLFQSGKAASQNSIDLNNKVSFIGSGGLANSSAYVRFIPINHSPIASNNFNLNAGSNSFLQSQHRFSMFGQQEPISSNSVRVNAAFNQKTFLNRKNSFGGGSDLERWRFSNAESPIVFSLPKSPHPDPRRMSRNCPTPKWSGFTHRSESHSSDSSDSVLSETEAAFNKSQQSVHNLNTFETKSKIFDQTISRANLENSCYSNRRNNNRLPELDLTEVNGKQSEAFIKYAKFSPYRRIGLSRIELSSSSDSLNKSNVLQTTRVKSSAPLYDSGIGVDMVGEEQRGKKVYSETLNPSMARKLNESSLGMVFSPASSISSSIKSRKKLEDLFQLNKLREKLMKRAESNSSKTSILTIPIRNLTDEKKLRELEDGSLVSRRASQVYSTRSSLARNNSIRRGEAKVTTSITATAASTDFTPQLLRDSVRQRLVHSSRAAIKENEESAVAVEVSARCDAENKIIEAIKKRSVSSLVREASMRSARPRSLGVDGDANFSPSPLHIERRRVQKEVEGNEMEANKQIRPKEGSCRVLANSSKLHVALQDYSPVYSRDLPLKKGEKYEIMSYEGGDWLLLRDKLGNAGYAPAHYLHTGVYEKQDKSHYEKEWFHGNTSRSQAYVLLMAGHTENGTFLLRNNSSEKGKYTLCVFKNGKVYNYKVNFAENKYFISPKHKFPSLLELVEFYKKNSAGLVCSLKYPLEKDELEMNMNDQNSAYKKFCIDRRDIEFYEKIGSGQFGVVLKAEYKKRKIVAVKKMKPGSREDEVNFNREANFMMKLQNLQETQHRNLMQFFGISKDLDDSILIVTEFVKYGSLFNYLLRHKEKIVSSKTRLDRLLNICIDVCDGMEYLEANHITHRDLATRNCLVGEGEVIKVADFGLARFTEANYIAHPQSQFPVKWSAPEVIKYRSYSSKSDVWSFSCLMYEVFTLGKMPYGGSTNNSIAAKQIISGIIPEKPFYCPTVIYENILSRAWNKEPSDRPTFKELLKQLKSLVD